MNPPFSQTFLDAARNLDTGEFSLDGSTVGLGKGYPWSVCRFRLKGGLQENVDVVEIHNGRLHFVILPTRGMGIYRADVDGLTLGWSSPVKTPVHPSFVNLQERGGLGWLKGFNEWIVRCGLSSMGAPGADVMVDNNGRKASEQLTLHGKIANLPAHKLELEITSEEIILRGEVDETMLFGPCLRLCTVMRTSFGSSKLTIEDTVTNLGAGPAEHQLLYHINYGEPLLEEGATFLAPIQNLAPRDVRAAEDTESYDVLGPPQNGFVEQVYFMELAGKAGRGETAVMLRNANGTLASVLRYSRMDFPCFSLWKNTAALPDGYVVGLEPGTAFPNARQFEREKGRVLTLKGGESRCTTLAVEALLSRDAVCAAEREIIELQAEQEPVVSLEPIPRFSDI